MTECPKCNGRGTVGYFHIDHFVDIECDRCHGSGEVGMTNDITILSCPICNNPKLREYGNGIYQCDVCETYFDKDENVVLTEQEWLQTCTTEQLAECISDITCNCWGCKRIYVEDCPNYARYKACFCDKEDVLEWLKQPHTNE